MENFIAHNPTKIFFGNNVLKQLPETISKYGKKVFLIYGKGSVVKYGYYKKVTDLLKESNFKFAEFSGIKSNPTISDVRKAVESVKKEQPDIILALGGGSVIDSAKIISLAAVNDIDAWDIMTWKKEPKKAIPIITILTLAATGTEMNGATVIQNHLADEKIGFVSPLIYPKASFLNPEFTTTVSKKYTVYGIVDLIAHALDSFFAKGEATLSDRFVAEIIKEAMEYAPLLLEDLENYDLRAKIMWAATCALNGTAYHGRQSSGDWGVHSVGHVISYLYDTPHGATLSIVYPAWLKVHSKRAKHRIKKLGQLLFNDNDVRNTIYNLQQFFSSINSPVKLTELGFLENDKSRIIELMKKSNVQGMNYKLVDEDYDKLMKYMW